MHILTLENVLEASEAVFTDEADKRELEAVRAQLEALQSHLSEKLASKLGVQHMASHCEPGDCTSFFGPGHDGQECPEVLSVHDDSDWSRGRAVRTPKPMVVVVGTQEGALSTIKGSFVSERAALWSCARQVSAPCSIHGVVQTASAEEALAAVRRSRVLEKSEGGIIGALMDMEFTR